MDAFPRISNHPKIMGGKACITGTRVTVGMLIAQLSDGKSFNALLDEYPYITQDDIYEALRYSAWLASAGELEIAIA